MSSKENKTVCLDVRPILAGGNDPFNKIMEVVNDLKQEETLEIINSFEPVPLINKLQKQGYKTWTERPESGLVHTFFTKESGSTEIAAQTKEILSGDFDETFKKYIGKMNYVDVRHLEMPEPMTTILSELEQLPKDYCLMVDHKKVPQFLLPEIKERGFEILYNKKSENHLQLLIFRKV